MKKIILIDNGHGNNTAGKCSPDKSLMEYAYTREIAAMIVAQLKKDGLDARLLVPEIQDIPLSTRSTRVNKICNQIGKQNVVLLSVHCNAAPPCDGKWHNARGWSAFTSPGYTKADDVATILYNVAQEELSEYKATFTPQSGKQVAIRTDYSDGDPDWEAKFWILTKTACPAVLTENLFQDNHEDVAYLLSEKGKMAIVNIHVRGIKKYLGV